MTTEIPDTRIVAFDNPEQECVLLYEVPASSYRPGMPEDQAAKLDPEVTLPDDEELLCGYGGIIAEPACAACKGFAQVPGGYSVHMRDRNEHGQQRWNHDYCRDA